MRNRPVRSRRRRLGRKQIRCDIRALGDDPPPIDRSTGKYLALFRFWLAGRRRPDEYRRTARHATRIKNVGLGWRTRDAEFRFAPAFLCNISRGGALLFLLNADAPPRNQTVWLCLGTHRPDDCVAATTLEVRAVELGQCAVRLAFFVPCPSRFLVDAVCGSTRSPKYD